MGNTNHNLQFLPACKFSFKKKERDCLKRMRSSGLIGIRISDLGSLGSCYIKWTKESFSRVDLSVPLMCCGPNDLWSLITDPDPAHPSRTQLTRQRGCRVLPWRARPLLTPIFDSRQHDCFCLLKHVLCCRPTRIPCGHTKWQWGHHWKQQCPAATSAGAGQSGKPNSSTKA